MIPSPYSPETNWHKSREQIAASFTFHRFTDYLLYCIGISCDTLDHFYKYALWYDYRCIPISDWSGIHITYKPQKDSLQHPERAR